MSKPHETGKKGEEEALVFFTKLGYKLVAKNWRFAKAEVDLIVENEDWIVFVEVKTRTNDSHGSPESFVSRAQQKHLIRAANHFADTHPSEKQYRFDVISILLEPQFQLKHIPEAFYP